MIIIILSIVVLFLFILLIGCNNYSLFNGSIKKSEKFSYLLGDGTNKTLYSGDGIDARSRNLWAQKLNKDGPVVNYIQQVSKQTSRPYMILACDKDEVSFNPKPASNSIRLVASITRYSKDSTFPIPQSDEYFEQGVSSYKFNIPFSQRKNAIVWRGQSARTRDNVLNYIKESSKYIYAPIDAKFVNASDKSNYMSPEMQAEYKFIMAIDGHGWPGNINWVMESGSVPILVTKNKVWFFDLLDPWVDYVPVTVSMPDSNGVFVFVDLIENINKVYNDPILAEYISTNAPKKMKKILRYQKHYIDKIFESESYSEVIKDLRQELESVGF